MYLSLGSGASIGGSGSKGLANGERRGLLSGLYAGGVMDRELQFFFIIVVLHLH